MNLTVTPGYDWNNADRVNATKLNLTGKPTVSLLAIDGVPIGSNVPDTGAFTTLTADRISGQPLLSIEDRVSLLEYQMQILVTSLAGQDIELPDDLSDLIE